MTASRKTCRACGRVFRGIEVFCPGDGSRLVALDDSEIAEADPLVGSVLDGRYRIRRILGEGGMGIVYEADAERIDRRVAVKVLREDFSRRPDVVERFRREAKSASRIGHPNIVDVLDFGETPEGASYFVMELLGGEDLADVLARDNRVSPSRAAAIVFQCARALAAAHAKGIVHRDIKPENVFLVERAGFPDFVKLVDFGVAKMNDPEPVASGQRRLTRTGMIFGTPEYMSPEQANGLPLDHRVDIYALGVILYELLTGRVPFEGESFMAVLSKHATQPVPPLTEACPGLAVSKELEAVVAFALCKDREKRFHEMGAMADALERAPEMPDSVPRDSLVSVTRTSVPGQPSPLAPASPLPVAFVAPQSDRHPSVEEDIRRLRRRPGTKRALVLAGGAALALCVGLFAGMLREPVLVPHASLGDRGDQNDVAAAVQPSLPVPPSAPEAEATPRESPTLTRVSATTPSVGARVTVHITTRPSGARLKLAGGGDVCSKTPCSIEVPAGEPLSLLARHGNQRSATTLRPEADTRVHLTLDAASEATRESTTDSAGDLKIPAAFK